MTVLAESRLAGQTPAAISSTDWLLSFSAYDRPRIRPSDAAWTERHDLAAFFEGRLFDREDLTSELRLSAGSADAEIVLGAYARWGEEALRRLRGSFVVAIADRARERVIVARDPLGSHPLFYLEHRGSIAFATAPRRLLAQPGVPRTLNRAALADHLCRRWPDLHETFFEAVRRVPPGWRAVLGGGRLQLERYWNPAPADRPMEWLTEDQIGQFDARLDRAVDRALSAGPAGIFLSGGLDSISIAAFASDRARRSGRPGPRALSLAFPDSACDERHIQTAVARQLGMPHHLLDFWQAVGSGGLFSEALALNRDVSMPVLNIWGPAYHTLARQGRANGVRTILTGMGGDEWLSVSSMLSADLISRGDLRGLTRHVRTMMRSYSRTASQTLHNQLWSNGLRPLMSRALYRLAPGPWQRSRLGRQVRSDPAWISPDPALRTRQVERAAGSLETADPPGGFYLRELRTSLDHPLMSWELDEQYEFGKLVGVQYHHPYWDVDLVETLFKTPPALLDRGGRSKGLVREALAKRFPTLGFERQRKVAATNFFRSVVAKEGAALIDAVGDVSTLDALGVVDGPPAIAAARKAVTGTPAEWFSAWSLLNLETWARQQVH